jgi:uncharacterized protein YndB with AHSA1/START domain
MATTDHSDLASFDDRYTMRYVRILPHSIERVWEAVTVAEQLNVWLMPVTEIEPRLGGRCHLSWGGPRDVSNEGEVLVFDPPRRARYGSADAAIEFQLEPADGGTRFTFLQLFSTEFRHAAMDDQPGGGLPAGPDTPWRPGFVAGFHVAFDTLHRFLDEHWSQERILTESARVVEIANHPGGKESFEALADHGKWRDLVDVYEKIIREQCPPR